VRSRLKICRLSSLGRISSCPAAGAVRAGAVALAMSADLRAPPLQRGNY